MKPSHPSLHFNNIPVSSTTVHKHLGILLDDNLNYDHHLKFVLNKVKKTIGLLRKFQQSLSRQSLIRIYKFIRLGPNFASNIHDTKRSKLLTRLWLGLSHLVDYKFRHNFPDCVSRMCTCGQDIETITYFLCHYPNHHCARKTLFHKTNQVSGNISRRGDSAVTKILLFCDNKLDFKTNKYLLMSKIEFISLIERFSCLLNEYRLMIQ